MPRHESKLPGWTLRPATGVRPGAIVALLAAYCFFIIAAWIVFGRGYAALDLTVVKVAQKSRGTAWFRRYESQLEAFSRNPASFNACDRAKNRLGQEDP